MTTQDNKREGKTRQDLKRTHPREKKRQGLRARAFCGCIRRGGDQQDKRPTRQKTNKTKDQQDKRPQDKTINDKTINDKTRQQEGRQDKTRLQKDPPPRKKRQGLRARAFGGCIRGGGLKRRQKTNKTKDQQDKRPARQKTNKTKDQHDKRPTRQKTNKTKDQHDKRPTRQKTNKTKHEMTKQ